MSDLSERLRNCDYANAPSRCMEAADEIDRLLAHYAALENEAQRDYQALEAELGKVSGQLASARKALETSRSCIEDIGSGKGGWAWEEVLQEIDTALTDEQGK